MALPANWAKNDNPTTGAAYAPEYEVKNDLGGSIRTWYGAVNANNQNLNNAVITQEAWIAPTLQNSWVNWGSGNSDAAYYKDREGMVHLQGFVKDGVITLNTVILTLPTGYRPNSTLRFLCGNWGTVAELAVLANGEVRCNGVNNNTGLSLDNIHFRAL